MQSQGLRGGDHYKNPMSKKNEKTTWHILVKFEFGGWGWLLGGQSNMSQEKLAKDSNHY